ncbi:glycosyltransferase family 39 protein [Candidatus Woesebacteria bacterium]|nr:glycosyltransferase family 39 protein [Candidatus Woesebacteria bacterium]
MKKFLAEWKFPLVLLLLILLFAIGIRLYNLNIIPVFVDEAIYVRWAQVMRAEPTLRFLPLSDGKQPLFMWLVIPFLKLFSDPLLAGRLVSVAAGAATLLGIFLLTYALFKSRKAAIIAALIYAVSPFSFFFDRMALVDSLLSTFGVWTLFFALVALRNLRLDFAFLTGFALGGGLLTKSPAIFYALMLPTTWLLARWPKEKKGKAVYLIKLLALFVVSLTIAWGMYNILRLGPNFHMIALRNKDYISPISHLWTNPKDPFIFFVDRSFEWIWAMGPGLALVLALVGLLNFRKYPKEILLLSAWFLFPILVQSEFARVFTARYILFSLPYLYILAASALQLEGKPSKILVGGLIIFLFTAFKFDYLLLTSPEKADLPTSERTGYLEEWTAGYGIKEVSEFLKQEYMKNPGSKIVVGTEGFFGTLPDGLQIYLNDFPQITVIGVGIFIDEVHPSLKESKKAGNTTYLVVNNTRLKADPEKLGLELIALYPKALRSEGTKEYTIYGPQEALLFFEVK